MVLEDRSPISARLQSLLNAVPDTPARHGWLLKAREGRPVFAATAADAEAVYLAIRKTKPVVIGADSEYQFTHGRKFKGRSKRWYDPRSIRPLLLALSVLERRGAGYRLVKFVIDVRQAETLPWIQKVLDLGDTLVFHGAHGDLLAFKALGLVVRGPVMDTYVAWNAIHRGRHHRRYLSRGGHVVTGEEARELKENRGGLVPVAAGKGIVHPFAAKKTELQHAFLTHPVGAAFTEEQIAYVAADATVTALLYLPMVEEVTINNVLHVVIGLEMPALLELVEMEWVGLRQDAARSANALREAQDDLKEGLRRLHKKHGVEGLDPASVIAFAERVGIKAHLRSKKTKSGFTTAKNHLDRIKHIHPAIPLILHAKNIQAIVSSPLLPCGFVSPVDDRVHPGLDLTGQDTGRISCRDPGLMALPKRLRYIIVPEPGYILMEFDYKAEEVVIAAALAADEQLLADLAVGDIYKMIAETVIPFPAGPVNEQESDRKRNATKPMLLSLLYGRTPKGLAHELTAKLDRPVSIDEARIYQQAIFDRYPRLVAWLKEQEKLGTERGWARTACGTRRARGKEGPVTAWELRWFRNAVVQGGGADIIRKLLVRLGPRLRTLGARVILAVHDSVLVEAPAGSAEVAKGIVNAEMIAVFQRILPGAPIRIEMKDEHPDGWGPMPAPVRKEARA